MGWVIVVNGEFDPPKVEVHQVDGATLNVVIALLAQPARGVRVLPPRLNVRRSPRGEVLTQLTQGTIRGVLEGPVEHSDGSIWVLVEEGWICKQDDDGVYLEVV